MVGFILGGIAGLLGLAADVKDIVEDSESKQYSASRGWETYRDSKGCERLTSDGRLATKRRIYKGDPAFVRSYREFPGTQDGDLVLFDLKKRVAIRNYDLEDRLKKAKEDIVIQDEVIFDCYGKFKGFTKTQLDKIEKNPSHLESANFWAEYWIREGHKKSVRTKEGTYKRVTIKYPYEKGRVKI